MSRIEEALRRARLSVLDGVAPSGEAEPAPPPEVVPVLDAVNDAASDSIEVAEAVSAVPEVEVWIKPVAPELAPPEPDAPAPAAVERWKLVADTLRDPMGRKGKSGEPRSEKLILNPDLPPAVTEQYRKAAASLHQLQLDRGVNIVMIASAIAEEGKTITATNIALTLSESFKRRVLLIDADLRRPAIHNMFGTPNATGLNDALKAERDEKLTIFQVTPHLSVLPAGRPDPDPMSSLSSERMRTIVTEAGTKFDWVVLDTPPVGVLPDAKLLAEMVHVVVLVVGAGRTPFRDIERAVTAIDRKRIAGVVLNRVVEQPAAYQYDYYMSAGHRG